MVVNERQSSKKEKGWCAYFLRTILTFLRRVIHSAEICSDSVGFYGYSRGSDDPGKASERCSTRTDGENSNGQHARGVLPLYGHIVRLPRLVSVVTTRNRRSYYTRMYDVQFPLLLLVVQLFTRSSILVAELRTTRESKTLSRSRFKP